MTSNTSMRSWWPPTTVDRNPLLRTPWCRWMWSQFASLAGKVGLLLSILWSEGSLAWYTEGARPILSSSQHITRGIFKVQSLCCKKWSTSFILTTPKGYITPILQLRMSVATCLTSCARFVQCTLSQISWLLWINSNYSRCSAEKASKTVHFIEGCWVQLIHIKCCIITQHSGKGAMVLGFVERVSRQRLEIQNPASGLRGF